MNTWFRLAAPAPVAIPAIATECNDKNTTDNDDLVAIENRLVENN
jgi:hypothetical protein